VKRLSADDSVVLPCESRSLPNTYFEALMIYSSGLLSFIRAFLPYLTWTGCRRRSWRFDSSDGNLFRRCG